MKEQIKQLRVEIDGLAQLTKELKPETKFYFNPAEIEHEGRVYFKDISKELEKAVDSLYLAKAWLGKVLGELGNENPYGSGYKTKEDIVPTQDVATISDIADKENLYDKELIGEIVSFDANWKNKNHIEKVDWLRGAIEQVLIKIRFIGDLPLSGTAYSNTFINNVTTHLSEARFWLGFELERIKQSN